jgi:hypothetical protein
MTTNNNAERDAKFAIDAVRTRGGYLPHILDAFPEVGMIRKDTAIVNFACPSCGSRDVSVKDSFGFDRSPSLFDLRETGSSLRLFKHDFDEADYLDGLSRSDSWTISCGAGGGCDYSMSAARFLDAALAKVGAVELVKRLREVRGIMGDLFPREASYFVGYLERNKARVLIHRSFDGLLGGLRVGAGQSVFVQKVVGISEDDAQKQLSPKAWTRYTVDRHGEALSDADIAAQKAARAQAEERRKQEIQIEQEVEAFRAKLLAR